MTFQTYVINKWNIYLYVYLIFTVTKIKEIRIVCEEGLLELNFHSFTTRAARKNHCFYSFPQSIAILMFLRRKFLPMIIIVSA